MKTQEQKTAEAMTYLEKTSKHIFLNGKGEYWTLVKIGDGQYKTVTGKETRSWEQLTKYLGYYKNDPRSYFQNQFFPAHLKEGDRSGIYHAIKRKRVDPEFLKLIEALAPVTVA